MSNPPHTKLKQQAPASAIMTNPTIGNSSSVSYGTGYNNQTIQPSNGILEMSQVTPLSPEEIISNVIGDGQYIVDFFLKATTNKTALVEQLWWISKKMGRPIKKKIIQEHLDYLQDYLKSGNQKAELSKISSALKYVGYVMVANDIKNAASSSKDILNNPNLSQEEKADALYRNIGNLAIDTFLPPVRLIELILGDPSLREKLLNGGKSIGDFVGGNLDKMWVNLLTGSKFEKLILDNRQEILDFFFKPTGSIPRNEPVFPPIIVGTGSVASIPDVQSRLTPPTPANVYIPRQCIDPNQLSPIASNKDITDEFISTVRTYRPR